MNDCIPNRWLRSCAYLWASAAVMLAVLASCKKHEDAPAPPPPAVTVAHPVQREVIEWDEYTGRLDAVESVEVRARVSGLIESAPFQEGTNVKKGDVLFVIDVRPFKAELDAKVADVAQAKAAVEKATLDLGRISEAVKANAVSQRDYDAAKAAFDTANAQLAATKAAEDAARLNVEWCQVVAPIDGRVSNKRVTSGNLVNGGAGQATLLTTLVSMDPIYCYINADEASVLKYAELAREGKRVSARHARIPTFMAVATEKGYPHEGVVDFVDNRIDPGTGTVRGRGIYPNPDEFLQPGMFARVRIPGSGRYDALLVPDSAIVTDQNQKLLMVVNAENTVTPHPVKLGALFGDVRAIVSGISPSDRVIINGLTSARPGAKVNPQETEISLGSWQPTAPGSPTTQALPTTQMAPPVNAAPEPTTKP